MNTWKTLSLIVVVIVVFGVLMAYATTMPLDWTRALVAAAAFGFAGVLFSYLATKRNKD